MLYFFHVDTGHIDPYCRFWITWSSTSLSIGKGTAVGADIFLQWHNIPPDKSHDIEALAFKTVNQIGQWEFPNIPGINI